MLKLLKVMARLRDPNGGCPWDLQQSFKTIYPYTIEEAYEVADAIENEDWDSLKDELGDLLLQSVYHAQMATEDNLFTFEDVAQHVADKMIERHPHVFGDGSANDENDVNAIWEVQKEKERSRKAGRESTEKKSALDGVALALPSLMRAQKLQKRASRTGFEWTKTEQILDKLDEEIKELRHAVEVQDQNNVVEEFGDILFVIANLARLMNVDCEGALRSTNRKFETRFKGMEDDLEKSDRKMTDLTLDEILALWQKQKTK